MFARVGPRLARWSPAVLLLVVSLGCGGANEATTPSTSTTAPPSPMGYGGFYSMEPPSGFLSMPLGESGCSPPSPISTPGYREGSQIRATSSTSDTAFGLLIARRVPIRQGDEVKIVWRITGNGDLSVRVTDPTDLNRSLHSEPRLHGNPGGRVDEWGTFFLFDVAGCWHIELRRQNWIGDVWMVIDP